MSLKIKQININLNNVVLLDEKGKENLLDFSFSGINEIDFTAYLTEVRKSQVAWGESFDTEAVQNVHSGGLCFNLYLHIDV